MNISPDYVERAVTAALVATTSLEKLDGHWLAAFTRAVREYREQPVVTRCPACENAIRPDHLSGEKCPTCNRRLVISGGVYKALTKGGDHE